MTAFNQGTRSGRPVRATTHEGGEGIKPSALVDLAFTTACTYIGQATFYETAEARVDRIKELVRAAGAVDPDGVVKLIGTLRMAYGIRSAPIVVAAEFVHAFPGHKTRLAVANACWRADEPAEFLAYWMANYSRNIPRGVKLGLGDAAQELYTQRAAMKWDSKDRAVRMGDVIELCHVQPETPEQSTLFRYLLDLRHRGKDAWGIDSDADEEMRPIVTGKWMFQPGHLQMFLNRRVLNDIPTAQRRDALRAWGLEFLTSAGMTWEQLSSWLPGGMDAEAWEWAIPRMGVMALVRNLRNFDEAKLPDMVVDHVIDKITNSEDVRGSRIFPYQVLTAYAAVESDNWQRALGKTLDHASANVPKLDRTLILLDTSNSMGQAMSENSTVTLLDVAALQAVSVAKNSDSVDIGIFATSNGIVEGWRGLSTLRATQDLADMRTVVGVGTNGHTAIRDLFNPKRHDRVVMFTDDQMRDSGMADISHVPEIITFNIGGYMPKSTWGRLGSKRNIQVAGFSDEIFRAVVDMISW